MREVWVNETRAGWWVHVKEADTPFRIVGPMTEREARNLAHTIEGEAS